MAQSLTIANAHSVVIDSAHVASKQIALRVYDVAQNQLLNVIVNTDTTTPTITYKNAPPPPPTVVKVNGSAKPLTVAAGSAITASVTNGPGNPGDWLGVYAAGAPSGPGNPMSWKWLSTDDARRSIPPAPGVKAGMVHLVTPHSAGQYEVRFFSSASFNVIANSAAITATGAAPSMPKTVVLTPASASVPDNSPVGMALSTIAVAMTDGSPFSGSLAATANNMVGLSNGTAVLTRALAASDDGAHSFVITATQGGGSASATLALTISPPLALVLSLSPLPSQIDDASPAGLVLSTATVKYSDGTTPANVTLSSSDPSFVAVQGMQLVLARALTSADDGHHNVVISASDGLAAAVMVRLFGDG